MRSTDRDVDVERGSRTVDRSSLELSEAPFELAFRLLPPGDYVVYLSSAGVASTSRCYALREPLFDDVLLLEAVFPDADADGFLLDSAVACRDPDGPCDNACPEALASDCDDTDFEIHPGARVQCLNGLDEDCDGEDEACDDDDRDGWNGCPEVPTEPCDCNDVDPEIHPGVDDVCIDGIDQDCDGLDACCDDDGDGFPFCTYVSINPSDCDDRSASVYPGASEPCNGVDDNCDGRIDEPDECRGSDADADGSPACAVAPGPDCDCDDCNAAVDGRTEVCGFDSISGAAGNGIDEDCDGVIDEACIAGDMDGDGVLPPDDCDDTDPWVYPRPASVAAVDKCDDGVSARCDGSSDSCAGDLDGDGWLEPWGCDSDAAIGPDLQEVCNGRDDDCDGVVDDVAACVLRRHIDYATNLDNCGACRASCDLDTSNECILGGCVCAGETTECTSGESCCAAGCVDVQNDVMNCGACGNVCGTGHTCIGSQCRCGPSPACTPPQQCNFGVCVF